jgi:ribosomal subunit interface protein
MTVIVESKQLKLTKALRDFATSQAQRLLKFGEKGVLQIRIHMETVRKKSNDPKANIVTYAVTLPGKKLVVVKKTAVDMYEALVSASHETLRGIRKVRERRLDKKRLG